MFLKGVWVVQVHTFLKDGLKDILLEQSAHMLLNTNLSCVMGINGLLIGLSVCIHRGHTLEAKGLPETYIDVWGKGGGQWQTCSLGRQNVHLGVIFWCFLFISPTSYNLHNFALVCVCVVVFFHPNHIFWFWEAQGVLCKC